MPGKTPLFLVVLLSFLAIFLSACARFTDLKPGTVLEVTSPAAMAPAKSVQAESPRAVGTSVIEQENVKVDLPAEPPPPVDYIVGPNDVLFINVSGKPEFSSFAPAAASQMRGSRVDGQGFIQFPFLGAVHVSGKTLQEIQRVLRQSLTRYINDPWVVVEVAEYRSHPLYLLGQFRNSGTHYMDRPLNLLQGIALGNGHDATANLSAARLIRDKKILPVDIHDLLTRGDQSQNIWLRKGDTIYIPDNRNQQVFVFGAVRKAGPLPLPPTGLTLAQAIASAELREVGFDLRHVRIIRSHSTTRGELMVVDFEKMLRGQALPMLLKEGDIVFIPRSGLGSWNDAINEILPSLQIFSAILQPFVQIRYLTE